MRSAGDEHVGELVDDPRDLSQHGVGDAYFSIVKRGTFVHCVLGDQLEELHG